VLLHCLAKQWSRKLHIFHLTLYVDLPTNTKTLKTHSNYHLVTERGRESQPDIRGTQRVPAAGLWKRSVQPKLISMHFERQKRVWRPNVSGTDYLTVGCDCGCRRWRAWQPYRPDEWASTCPRCRRSPAHWRCPTSSRTRIRPPTRPSTRRPWARRCGSPESAWSSAPVASSATASYRPAAHQSKI